MLGTRTAANGTGKTTASPGLDAPSNMTTLGELSKLLKDAQELVGRCKAATPASGGYGPGTSLFEELSIPSLQRTVEQMREASGDIAMRSATHATPQALSKGYASNVFLACLVVCCDLLCRSLLLATKGFDQGKLSEQVTALQDTALFRVTQAVDEGDVEAYLQHHYEEAMLSVLEELQGKVQAEAEALARRAKEANWERTKRLYFEKRGVNIMSSTIPVAAGTAAVGEPSGGLRRKQLFACPKTEAYGQVVRRLNEARLTETTFSPAFAFGKAAQGLVLDHRMEQLVDCWECVGTIANELADDTAAGGNVFLSAGSQTAALPFSNAVEWRRHVTRQSRKFLEAAFVRYMDRTIAMYPREAMLGGRPSRLDRARALLNIRLKRMAPGESSRLEMFPLSGQGATTMVPLWPFLFILVRSGWLQEALELATASEASLQRNESSFVSYLKAFVESKDQTVPAQIRAQIRADYAQRLLGPPQSQDPYKLLLLKIIGRCDLSKRSADIITTSEDYLWLQLWLVTEISVSASAGGGDATDYDLEALQRMVLGYGSQHFDPKGNNPLRYFHVLLLVGLFEEAIAALYPNPAYQLDAVHFAIALAYHACLRISSSPEAALWGEPAARNAQAGNRLEINFGGILAQFGQALGKVDAIHGLQYVFLLTLPKSPAYNVFAQSLVHSLILQSPADATILLGDTRPDGTIQPGYLAKHAKLLGLPDPVAFIDTIVVKTAELADREGRFEDALQLYNLAGQYSRVLGLLGRRLAQSFALTSLPLPTGHSDLVNTCTAILKYYQSQDHIRNLLGQAQVSQTETLLRMCRVKAFCEASNWAAAIHLVESDLAGLVPLACASDSLAVARLADQFKAVPSSSNLTADPVNGALPDLLLLTMTALNSHFQTVRQLAHLDAGRQQELLKVRQQARALMIYVGLLGNRVPAHVCAQMTRLDILMN